MDVDDTPQGEASGLSSKGASPAASASASASVPALVPRAARETPAQALIDKKRALAQLVVHDLRNPLTAAHGYVQLAKEELGTLGEAGRVREYLDDVTTLLDKTLGLVSTILDVEELEDGMLHARPTATTFRALVDRALAGHMRQFERRGLTLSVDGAIDDQVWLDVDLIGRVVENLLDNSARYAPRGGRVCAHVAWVGEGLELAIGNNGPPVAARDLEAIFGRYYQLEARRASARANRGLGLYFCKLAVSAHQGRIGVESRGELGAVFVVRIPRHVAAPLASTESEVAPQSSEAAPSAVAKGEACPPR